MSYSDYMAGFRDGAQVGLNAGYRMGFGDGYATGYDDGAAGLPFRPRERLHEALEERGLLAGRHTCPRLDPVLFEDESDRRSLLSIRHDQFDDDTDPYWNAPMAWPDDY